MKEYTTPLSERRKRSERYWSDPQFRLAQVNYIRRSKGRPLLSAPEEIGTGLKLHARSRQRGERGRFV